MKPTEPLRRIGAPLRKFTTRATASLSPPDRNRLTKPAGFLALVVASTAPAAAQDTGAASDAFCSSGIGEVVGLALVLLSVLLGLYAAFRLSIGLMNMGSSRQDKIQDGRQQVKGAGLALMGALAPAAISAILATLGIPTVDCIDLSSYLGGGGVVAALTVIPL